jgi:hypothetical protein
VSDPVWLTVPGFPRYEASSDGHVRRIGDVHPLSQRPCGGSRADNQEYVKVDLDGIGITVHAVVAATFIGPRPLGRHIDHVNGIKTDNRAANLEYVLPRENNRRSLFVRGFDPRVAGAEKRPRKASQCSRCGGTGHNKATCENQLTDEARS